MLHDTTVHTTSSKKKTFVSLVVAKFIYSWGMLIGLMLRHVHQNYWRLREALCCLSLAHGPFESIWHSVSRFFKGARNLCAPSAAHISTICYTNSEMHGQSYLDMQKHMSLVREYPHRKSFKYHKVPQVDRSPQDPPAEARGRMILLPHRLLQIDLQCFSGRFAGLLLLGWSSQPTLLKPPFFWDHPMTRMKTWVISCCVVTPQTKKGVTVSQKNWLGLKIG